MSRRVERVSSERLVMRHGCGDDDDSDGVVAEGGLGSDHGRKEWVGDGWG